MCATISTGRINSFYKTTHQYEKLIMEQKEVMPNDVNINTISQVVSVLLSEFAKRGVANYGWTSAPIADLKHAMMSAISRKDWRAFLVYQCMIASREHDPLEHISAVLENLHGCIERLNDESAHHRNRAADLESKLKDNQAFEPKSDGVNVDCRCTPPFRSALADFLAQHVESWPKGVVAFGPLTTFNGIASRPDLEQLVVTPDLLNRDDQTDDGTAAGDGGSCVQIQVKISGFDSERKQDYEYSLQGTPEQIRDAILKLNLNVFAK